MVIRGLYFEEKINWNITLIEDMKIILGDVPSRHIYIYIYIYIYIRKIFDVN